MNYFYIKAASTLKLLRRSPDKYFFSIRIKRESFDLCFNTACTRAMLGKRKLYGKVICLILHHSIINNVLSSRIYLRNRQFIGTFERKRHMAHCLTCTLGFMKHISTRPIGADISGCTHFRSRS